MLVNLLIDFFLNTKFIYFRFFCMLYFSRHTSHLMKIRYQKFHHTIIWIIQAILRLHTIWIHFYINLSRLYYPNQYDNYHEHWCGNLIFLSKVSIYDWNWISKNFFVVTIPSLYITLTACIQFTSTSEDNPCIFYDGLFTWRIATKEWSYFENCEW